MLLEERIIIEDMEDIYKRNIDWNILNKKTVLVTGAYGMLASYVVYYLCYLSYYKNINVKILAQGRNYEKGKEKFGELLSMGSLEFTTFDICSDITFEGDIDYIIHAAGLANPRLYSTMPVEVAEPNVLGTSYLLKLARQKSVKGFLIFSSGDVYGKVDNPNEINENTIGRVNQLDDHSCYSESKRMSETLGYCYFKEYGIPVKIARIGHTYGPTLDVQNDPRVFSSFLKCLLEGRDIEMLSNGMTKRPFCYLADAVGAYFTILFMGQNGAAYNVCNNNEFISMRDFANIVVSLDDSNSIKIVYKGRETTDGYVENTVNLDNIPSDKKLKSLGFDYHYSTFDGVKRTYDYLKDKKML